MEFDLAVCAEDMYWIEYRLLAFPAALPNTCREEDIDKACRVGALIYIKATLQEFPHSNTGFSLLLGQLQEALDGLPIEQAHLPLLAVSKAPEGKKWFVGRLAKLVARSGISSFRDELDMTSLLSVRLVLGTSLVDKVWENVMGVANTTIR